MSLRSGEISKRFGAKFYEIICYHNNYGYRVINLMLARYLLEPMERNEVDALKLLSSSSTVSSSTDATSCKPQHEKQL